MSHTKYRYRKLLFSAERAHEGIPAELHGKWRMISGQSRCYLIRQVQAVGG